MPQLLEILKHGETVRQYLLLLWDTAEARNEICLGGDNNNG